MWWCDSWHWFHLPLPGKMSWTNSAWKNWAKPKDRKGGDLWVKMGRTRAVVPNGWRPWTWFYLLLRPAMALAMAASQWPSNYCLQSLPAVPQVTVSLFQLNLSFFSVQFIFFISIYLFSSAGNNFSSHIFMLIWDFFPGEFTLVRVSCPANLQILLNLGVVHISCQPIWGTPLPSALSALPNPIDQHQQKRFIC